MTTIITVFFTTGEEKNFTDEPKRKFDFVVTEGQCRIKEQVLPSGGTTWEPQRTIHVYPPGVWREVEVDYGS